MSKSVPFFNYPYLYGSDSDNLHKIISDVCKRGAFILQRENEEFERSLAQYTGAKFALGVSDGTEAITIALNAAGLKPGDEVIFCSHTFIATASAIHYAGGMPVPVECGSDRLIDPRSAEAAITSKTRAIVPTQLNGRVCDMDALISIAEKYNLFIVEDAAQALGAKYKDRSAGTFGAAGTISFYPAKSLGCFGDGGAILTNDTKMYQKMKLLRDHGRDENGEIVVWGYNARLDNLQAAILDYKLKSFPRVIDRRRQLAARYHRNLNQLAQVTLPPTSYDDGVHFDTYQNYEIDADRRDELQLYLKEKGVGTIKQWGGKAVHQFSKLGFNISLPFTERFFTRCMMLPLNMSLSDDDIDYVSECIHNFYRN